MEYTEAKRCLARCPELAGLDPVSTASLFWLGEERTLKEGEVIYAEDTPLDDTLCVLLSGYLLVSRGGMEIGVISGEQIFGEMAYFTASHARTATVTAAAPQTVILKVQLTPEELGGPRFSPLKQYLGREAWDRFVSSSQQNVV